MTPNDRELVLQLLEDAALMESNLTFGLPTPSTARAIFAPVLRRWIAEGKFYQAQKAVGGETRFELHSRSQAVKLCQAGVYEHWMGGVDCGDVWIQAGQYAKKYLDKDNHPTMTPDRDIDTKISQKAKLFFEQKSFFWKGVFYTPIDIIKFLANTLGGVHFSFDRLAKETHIREIKNYFGIFCLGSNTQMLVGEDIERPRADPNKRGTVYDAIDLTVIDTAKIFAAGVRSNESRIRVALSGPPQ